MSFAAVCTVIRHVTFATIIVLQVNTSSIHTRTRSAFVRRVAAPRALESSLAYAFVTMVTINTRSIIETRRTQAFIDVFFAVFTRESLRTYALIIILQINAAVSV